MEERRKLPQWEFKGDAPRDFGQIVIQMQENSIQLNTFWSKI